MNRKLIAALFAIALCSWGAAIAADRLTVGAIFYGKVSEGNWEPPSYQAFEQTVKKYGWKSSYVEGGTFDRASEILNDYGSRGTDIVFAHSSGYATAVLDAAKRFPKTTFSVLSSLASTGGLPNVNGWSFRWQELGFLDGIVAGQITKSNKIGVVAGDEIPAIAQAIGGFIEGVKHVNPNAQVTVSWVGSWSDVAKARELAAAQIAQGVDVVTPYANTASLGVFEAARQNKIPTFGLYVDESKVAPEVIVTSAVINWEKLYDTLGGLYASGKLEAKIYPLTVREGYISLTPLQHVSPEVIARTDAIIAEIRAGKLEVKSTVYKR